MLRIILIIFMHIVFLFQTNAKGQVTVSSSVLKQMEDIKEETGLTCCICREGYRYQPQKVHTILVKIRNFLNKLF